MIKNTLIVVLCLFTLTSIVNAQEIKFTDAENKWIKEHPIIYHGYDATWHPFEFYNEKDTIYSGIISEYIKIVENKTGVDFRPIPNITWEETIKTLETGEIDLATGITANERRKQFLNFTKPYMSFPLVIVTRKDYQFIGGLNDLIGKEIALPVGFYTSEMISRDFPKIKINHKKDVKEALESVSFGETDAFVGNLAVVSYYINKEGFTNIKIAAPTRYKNSDLSFGVRKDWPELVSIIDKVIDAIPPEQHNAIRTKWIQVRYEYGVNIRKIVYVAGILLLVVLLIITTILLWNRSLQREIVKRNIIEEKLESSLLELEKKNDEKRAMLKEIHHRVKNNLQVVNSLLKLQSRKLKSEEAVTMFKETQNRVVSMALLHEKMYRSDDIHQINVQDYISLLVKDLVKSYAVDKNIHLNIQIEPVNLMMRTLVPLGLIINEMITNSLKHGFKNKSEGEISVSIRHIKEKRFEMIIGDNGDGVAKEHKSTGIGVNLIKIFTKQLNGTLEQLDVPGAVFKLTFDKIDVT
ncbi:MAG: histidine kinase dimerization/phosphoacceptor domain -containing protein [Flavobacteriaceae bacterium]